MSQFQIAVLVGSLRRESLNARLAGTITLLAPPEFVFRTLLIGELPWYNQDDDADPAPPVQRLKADIAAAPGVLFVVPEYNRCVPGVVKHAIDHASCPHRRSVWKAKPAGVLRASARMTGTAVGR